MMMELLQILIVGWFLSSTSLGFEVVKNVDPFQNHLVMPGKGGLNCESWRFGVETNNIVNCTEIPSKCVHYVKKYMLGKQYGADLQAVIEQASLYAHTLNLSGDGYDIWVFDIDDTLLSSLPYYIETDFGMKPNNVSYMDLMAEAKFPALEDSRGLYEELLDLGFKIVFLTGRRESYRNATVTNLTKTGFHTWETLILKETSYTGTSLYYKTKEREKLEKNGYRIRGNIGDQWSDLMGTSIGDRTFKLPNPLYYNS